MSVAGAAIDHLVIAATNLAEGVAWAEARLGAGFAGGGAHLAFGTHNRLMRLGDVYLEVIAVDPAAPAPAHPRWFALDHFTGPPRLLTWVMRTDDLDGALREAPCPATAMEAARGDLRWRFGVGAGGALCMGGAWPSLIEWGNGGYAAGAHPVPRLPDNGLVLKSLSVDTGGALPCADARLARHHGGAPVRAVIATPKGEVRL